MVEQTDMETFFDENVNKARELLKIYNELDQAFQNENDLEAWNLAMSFAPRCKPILEMIVDFASSNV